MSMMATVMATMFVDEMMAENLNVISKPQRVLVARTTIFTSLGGTLSCVFGMFGAAFGTETVSEMVHWIRDRKSVV